MKKVLFVILLMFMVVLAVMASNKKSTQTGQPNGDSSNTGTNTPLTIYAKVTMTNMLFTPSQVTIKKGDTVTWTNKDKVAHTVTTDLSDELVSQKIEPGATYSHIFIDSGSYQYHCEIYSAMHGTIVVQ